MRQANISHRVSMMCHDSCLVFHLCSVVQRTEAAGTHSEEMLRVSVSAGSVYPIANPVDWIGLITENYFSMSWRLGVGSDDADTWSFGELSTPGHFLTWSFFGTCTEGASSGYFILL